ncbi:MAG: CoA-binding protein [Microcoleaceae cyanobacterium]
MQLTPDSQILIQGINTSRSSIQATQNMKSYGTNVVACVSPGRGNQKLDNIPVFDLVEQAIAAIGTIETSVIFLPPYQVLDAALEAIDAGIRQLVILTEGVPPLDMVRLVQKAEMTDTLVVGPNSPGIIIPDQLLLGTYPRECYQPGSVGLISRSSTLNYEIALALTQADLGQSMSVSIGSDLIVGSSLIQWLQILDEDEPTEVIVLIGAVGGSHEEEAALYITEAIDKPVVAYIAGLQVPQAQLMGHANSILTTRIVAQKLPSGTAESKIAAFKKAKIPLATRPSEIPSLVKKVMKKKK